MRARCGWLLSLALAFAGAAYAATLEPKQFAYGMPIATPGEAAEYRLEIPPEVYLKSVQPGLRDLQIFNGKGSRCLSRSCSRRCPRTPSSGHGGAAVSIAR